MRIGMNPQKQEKKLNLETHHRILVVVYIPNEDGFYKNSFEVFKLCLDSLVTSINKKAAITIINNGSYHKVTDLLNEYISDDKIDTLIYHKKNIGKIDALIGAARSSREHFITYSDSDILFLKGWQENVETIFETFPNVGSVSPIPYRFGLNYGTSSLFKYILNGKLKYKPQAIPENFSAHNRYLDSINWKNDETDNCIWPVVEKNNMKAVVGSGHQVLTITRDMVFKTVPMKPSLTLVGGDSEYKYVDEPIDKIGKLRLSTYHNYGYHMGNTVENWIRIEYEKNLENSQINSVSDITYKNNFPISFMDKVRHKIFVIKKIIYKKFFNLMFNKHDL